MCVCVGGGGGKARLHRVETLSYLFGLRESFLARQ